MVANEKEVGSILVIRSAPLLRTFEALKKLREVHPNAEVSVLVQPEVKDEIEKTCLRATHRQGGLADKVIVGIKKGRISLFRHLPLVTKLRRESFDLVAVIYNTEDTSWYANLRLFACAIRAKERVGITTQNIFQSFSLGEVVFKDLVPELLKSFRLIFIIPLTGIFSILLIPLVLFYYLRGEFRRLRNKRYWTSKRPLPLPK